MIHTYSVANDTATGSVELQQLMSEMGSLSIDKICVKNGDIMVTTSEMMSAVTPIINAHTPSPVHIYKNVVKEAINFFNEELVQFSAENIAMGITVYGKTKDVADYLQNVMRYGQSGSLYEVVNEIDNLIAAGLPTGLSPFVTVARLNKLKANILEYLS